MEFVSYDYMEFIADLRLDNHGYCVSNLPCCNLKLACDSYEYHALHHI